MPRRTFSDVISSFNISIENEYNKLRHLFFEKASLYVVPGNKFSELITPYRACNNFFHLFPFRRTMLSLSEFDEQYNLSFANKYSVDDVDTLICLCEYVFNLSYYILQEKYSRYSSFLCNHIETLIEELHYSLHRNEDESFFIIPDDEVIQSVSMELPEEEGIMLLQYTHHSKVEDIDFKKSILRMIADKLEPIRTELNNNQAKLFFNYINNCNIRHNNVDKNGSYYRPYIAKKNNEEIISIYDKLFSLGLLLLFESNNRESIRELEAEKDLIGAIS